MSKVNEVLETVITAIQVAIAIFGYSLLLYCYYVIIRFHLTH